MAEYIYRGDRLTDQSLKGKECDAVRRSSGKCIVSKLGTMLVSFNGTKHNVIRYMLRKIK